MSVHKDCGEEIRWVRRDDDETRWAPPIEFAGHFFILTEDGKAVYTACYRRHECDPEKIEAWQAYQRRIAELKNSEPEQPKNMWEVARARRREEASKLANAVACPSCGADVGQQCMNRTTLKKTGEVAPTLNPHPERLRLAEENK
jgi:hypothetical protein